MTVKVDGSDIHLRYRDIISAEHFAHMINIRTTAGKTLATRQSFKAFTEPLKKGPALFLSADVARSSIWRMLPIFRLPPSV